MRKRLRIAAYRLYDRLVHTPWSTLLGRLKLWQWEARVGEGLRVRGRLRLHLEGLVQIGRDVRLNSGRANYVGGDRDLAISVGRNGQLTIGDGCGLSNSTICCHHRVVLLEGTMIGGGCDIYDTDFHQLDPAGRLANVGPVASGPVVIGPRAFVGAGTVVLKNVTIGAGAVIGAGSIVTRDVPAMEVWAGRPARFVKRLSPADHSPQPQAIASSRTG